MLLETYTYDQRQRPTSHLAVRASTSGTSAGEIGYVTEVANELLTCTGGPMSLVLLATENMLSMTRITVLDDYLFVRGTNAADPDSGALVHFLVTIIETVTRDPDAPAQQGLAAGVRYTRVTIGGASGPSIVADAPAGLSDAERGLVQAATTEQTVQPTPGYATAQGSSP